MVALIRHNAIHSHQSVLFLFILFIYFIYSPGLTLNERDFTEAVFLAYGLSNESYQLGLTKVFFRPGKQEFLETVLGSGGEIPVEVIQKIRSILIRKKTKRVRAGILLLVRLQLW